MKNGLFGKRIRITGKIDLNLKKIHIIIWNIKNMKHSYTQKYMSILHQT